MQRSAVAAVLLFLALAPGCGGGGSSEPVNGIKIERVTSTPAADGISTTFIITVSYDLQTAESAVITHCYLPYFGNQAGDGWMGCPVPITGITGTPVSRGQRTITITDTKAVTSTSDLRVILVPDQNSNSTVGVVSDVQTIIAQ